LLPGNEWKMSERLGGNRLDRLVDLGPSLVSALDLEKLLGRLLETAHRVTGARYAVLAIFDSDRYGLERLVTRGISADQKHAIEAVPAGRGVLGLVAQGERTLRVADVRGYSSSSGLPAEPAKINSFLGVPILIRDIPCGAVYLTDKLGGEFDDGDEEWLITIAAWASIAIEHDRLLAAAASRQQALERAVRGLEATNAIAVAVGAETDLARVLELVAEHGLAIVEARDVVILLQEGDDLAVAAGAGVSEAQIGARIPIAGSSSGQAMVRQEPWRVMDVRQLRSSPERFGVYGAHSALIVPLVYRGRSLGVLGAFDRDEHAYTFTAQDERLLVAFAASAATAVATAQSVQADRLRNSLDAAEAERKHWARELHDETLHALGGLKVLAANARHEVDPEQKASMLDQLVAGLESEIESVHAIVSELRPPALDDLGLRPAIESLIRRHAAQGTIEVTCQLELPDPGEAEQRLAPELETTVYRLVQEALTNVANHAEAKRLRIDVEATVAQVTVEVADDGCGFDVSAIAEGFGLTGMRERVTLAGGTIEIVSGVAGTIIHATLPARYAGPPPGHGTGDR
jgi:signal transduction histidine kinase